MDVSVSFEGRKRKVKLPATATIRDAIDAVDANEQTVIVKLNGKIAHCRKRVSQGGKVELVSIIYSG